ncbi:MAG: sigma-54 interaction domain-containing protein [Planctomycetota bacterium]|jgi:DNA-binding NtrC family response regulator
MVVRVTLAVKKGSLGRELRRLLSGPGVLLDTVTAKTRLWDHIAGQPTDIVVLSQSLIPDPSSETIGLLRSLPESPTIVVVSDQEEPEKHADLLAAGCDVVLYEDVPMNVLGDALAGILDRRRGATRAVLRQDRDMAKPRLADFVSESPVMRTFMQVVQRVVPSDVPLLILGETGVGKERLARAIHAEGIRGSGPFIAVNCGALPEALLESELFGHEKGAFTGASRTRRGWFELAHRGTVFLDEIGEMPYHLQVKLLRVLQDHEVQPIGSERIIPVDVRVMAASNRNLEAEVESRNFRRDLYYRLSVVTLTIPPLRERRGDIPLLVDSYIDYLQPRIGCDVEGITDEAKEALVNYYWPGNVRELINIIERALLLCDGRRITLADLPQAIRGKAGTRARHSELTDNGLTAVPGTWLEKPWSEVREAALANLERAYFSGLLEAAGGRVGETAERAGIRPRSLYDKMKRHGLCKEDYRG